MLKAQTRNAYILYICKDIFYKTFTHTSQHSLLTWYFHARFNMNYTTGKQTRDVCGEDRKGFTFLHSSDAWWRRKVLLSSNLLIPSGEKRKGECLPQHSYYLAEKTERLLYILGERRGKDLLSPAIVGIDGKMVHSPPITDDEQIKN
jgi:hypothetical protein